MSKQSEAKKSMGYVEKPFPRKCSTCSNYEYDEVTEKTYTGVEYTEKKRIRCSLGGFAVKANAVCDAYNSVVL